MNQQNDVLDEFDELSELDELQELESEVKQLLRDVLKEILLCIFGWMPLLFFWTCFQKLPGLYFETLELYIPGRYVLASVVVFGIIWLAVSSFQHSFRPPFWRVLMALVPVELCCLLFFMQYHLTLGIGLLAGFAVLQGIAALWIRSNMKEERRTRKGRRQCSSLTRRTAVLLLNLFLIVPAGMVLIVYGVDQPISAAEIAAEISGEQSIEVLVEENRAELERFQEETWNQLTVDERMDLLQTLVNLETSFLCLEPVEITGRKLEGNRLGQYQTKDNTISVDTVHLETAAPRDVINTISHECRHAYQKYVVDMLDWEDETVQTHYFYRSAQYWKVEFEDYTDGNKEEEFYEYYNQHIERDARSFGEQMLEALVYYMEWE